jgi:hypothetical protein
LIKRIALGLVLAVGSFWLISTFALGYPGKTQAIDNLTNSFRPAFTDTGLRQTSQDIATVNSFAGEFQNKAVPALATQLNVTPEQLVGTLGQQFPDVGNGLQQLPTILPYFNQLVDGLEAQQGNFQQADAIPTNSVPATSVHWLFVILGGVAIALAAVGLSRPRLADRMQGLAGVTGVAVIAVTFVLSVPTKAQGVDDLTNAFRPLFTSQGAEQTRAHLETVKSMNSQLGAEAVPGLAALLKITPEQLGASMQQNFPDVAAGLAQMPQILQRFEGLVSKIEANVANFQKADTVPSQGTPTTLLQAQLAAPAGLLILAAALGLGLPLLAGSRRRDEPAAVPAGTPLASHAMPQPRVPAEPIEERQHQ